MKTAAFGVIVLLCISLAALVGFKLSESHASTSATACVPLSNQKCPSPQWLETYDEWLALGKKASADANSTKINTHDLRYEQFLYRGMQDWLGEEIRNESAQFPGYHWDPRVMVFVQDPSPPPAPAPDDKTKDSKK